MKPRLASFLLFFTTQALAQSTFVVKAGEDPVKVLPASVRFLNSEYQPGYMEFSQQKKSQNLKINYDLLNQRLIFINDRGDTLSMNESLSVKYVLMGSYKFYHDTKEGYLKILATDSGRTLTGRTKLQKRVSGGTIDEGYGSSTNGTSAAISVIGKDEVTYERVTDYFLMNKDIYLQPANRQGFMKIFRKHDKAVKIYLKQNFVDFKKENDLVRLFNYCIGLNAATEQ